MNNAARYQWILSVILLSFMPAALLAQSDTGKYGDILTYVDPGIGTAHSRWFFYTPAAVPEGMAKLAPSTNGHYGNAQGWEAVGYDTRQHSIEGFVHFHEWQIGGVSFMPTTGPLKVRPGELDSVHSGYRSHFESKNEITQPGYYKVLLDDYQITAELTATKRVGFDRFTFPRSDQSHIILDIGNTQGESGKVINAGIRMVDDRHFEGFVITYPKYVEHYDPEGSVTMYFYGELDKSPESVGAFTAMGILPHSRQARGKGAGLFLNYKTYSKESIVIKVGLSYTSEKNARENLQTEAADLSFDQAKQKAQNLWRKVLGRILVKGKDDTSKIKFYTGLFHALLGRGVANDVDGSFPKYGGATGHLAKNRKGGSTAEFYNTDAIWGAYWNLTQLWALSYPQNYNDFVRTQLEVYKDRGWFGDGIANSNFVSGVGTNMVGVAVAAAYNAGIRDYDTKLAYRAVLKNELGFKNRKEGAGKTDIKAYLEKGYVPFIDGDDQHFETDSTGSTFSASHTLEYSFSAYAAAQMAKSMGYLTDYRKLMDYSGGWKYLFDTSLKLIRPKKTDGAFIGNFDPYQPWRGFQEGNAMQYTFFVPQDVTGLITAIGKNQFNKRLENIFETSRKKAFGGGTEINAFAGVKAIYNHGNEPDMEMSWLFNFSGKPWLTQKWTRLICDEFYGIQPIHGYGYGQDEDQGQLGSWYVMAALGLFDVKGFTDERPIIEFGSPVFDTAVVKLGNGKTLVIETKNNSKYNYYIQSASFNGKTLNNCWMYRDALMSGGKLVFEMGTNPNENWGEKSPPGR